MWLANDIRLMFMIANIGKHDPTVDKTFIGLGSYDTIETVDRCGNA